MKDEVSALSSWTPDQIEAGERWVETWRLASDDLDRIHRKELRELDTYRTIALLCGPRAALDPGRICVLRGFFVGEYLSSFTHTTVGPCLKVRVRVDGAIGQADYGARSWPCFSAWRTVYALNRPPPVARLGRSRANLAISPRRCLTSPAGVRAGRQSTEPLAHS